LGEEEGVVGVEQWAVIRRMHASSGCRSIREIRMRTGLHRKTIRRALAAEVPPKYVRASAGSKLDPFKEWICEQLRADPGIQSLRLREMAAELDYDGGKTIFDEYVREVRPGFVVARTFQRTIYRPGELVQCDLWEPREQIPVGYGQLRRGWVVTAELCWSRVVAGALIFSKEAPDILWGLGRCLDRIGALPEKLVWDREGAIGGGGRPSAPFAAFCGQLEVGWIILDAGDAQAKGVLERRTGSCAPTSSPAGGSRTHWIAARALHAHLGRRPRALKVRIKPAATPLSLSLVLKAAGHRTAVPVSVVR
jgi:hypothetical protein